MRFQSDRNLVSIPGLSILPCLDQQFRTRGPIRLILLKPNIVSNLLHCLQGKVRSFQLRYGKRAIDRNYGGAGDEP